MRQARILIDKDQAGILTEHEEGYEFIYDEQYLTHKNAKAVSLTLPLQQEVFRSEHLFPFFC